MSTHPLTPFLGGLLLNCLVILCLNLGGPLLGVVGPTLFGLMGESLRLSQLFPELISYTVCVSKKSGSYVGSSVCRCLLGQCQSLSLWSRKVGLNTLRLVCVCVNGSTAKPDRLPQSHSSNPFQVNSGKWLGLVLGLWKHKLAFIEKSFWMVSSHLESLTWVMVNMCFIHGICRGNEWQQDLMHT